MAASFISLRPLYLTIISFILAVIFSTFLFFAYSFFLYSYLSGPHILSLPGVVPVMAAVDKILYSEEKRVSKSDKRAKLSKKIELSI